jgi:cyclopropane-fatty-acyl-phospholipid synthase
MQHTERENVADLVVQTATILLLGALLLRHGPQQQRLSLMGLVVGGLLAWTLIEYCVHRFVLHGLRPWRAWHAQHHLHPASLVYAPTMLVSALFAALVFAPLLWLGGLWLACGLTLGVLCGYLFYSLTHLAIHRRTTRNRWLRKRQRWHAEHHRGAGRAGRYGVTTDFWDRLFALASKPASRLDAS